MNRLRRQNFDSAVAQLDAQIKQLERNRVHNQHMGQAVSRQEQLYQQGRNKQQNRRTSHLNTQLIKEQKEFQGCTFKPKINNYTPKASQGDIYAREMLYQKKKEQRIQQQQQAQQTAPKTDPIKLRGQLSQQKELTHRLATPKHMQLDLATPKHIHLDVSSPKHIHLDVSSPKTLQQSQSVQNMIPHHTQPIDDQNIQVIEGHHLQNEYDQVLSLLAQMKDIANNCPTQNQEPVPLPRQESKDTLKTKDKPSLDYSCLKTLGDLDIDETPVMIKKRPPSAKRVQQDIDYSNDNFVSLTSLLNPKYQFSKMDKRVDVSDCSYQLSSGHPLPNNKPATPHPTPNRPPLQFLPQKQHVSVLQQQSRPSSVRHSSQGVDFSKMYLRPSTPKEQNPGGKRLEALLKKSQEQSQRFQWQNTVELSSMV